MTKPTYKELERERKTTDFATTIIVVVLVILFVSWFFFIYKMGFKEQENAQLKEQINLSQTCDDCSISWQCPPLNEIGNYSFGNNGIIITPSGEVIECEVLP